MPEAIARRRRGSTPTCINVNCIVSTCTNVNCIAPTCININCIVYIICIASAWAAIGRRRGSPTCIAALQCIKPQYVLHPLVQISTVLCTFDICIASEWTAIGRRRRGPLLFGTGWCVMERPTAAPVVISTEHTFAVIVIVIETATAAAPVNIANATEHK